MQWEISVLNNFCHAEFLANCTLENKPNMTCVYVRDELDDNLIKNNHEECSYPLKINDIRYKNAMSQSKRNPSISPENFAHHVLLLSYPFRDEKDPLPGFSPVYQNKLQEQGVQDVNIYKIQLEPYGDLVDQASSHFSGTLIKNQDPHCQIENDETPGAEYPKDD